MSDKQLLCMMAAEIAGPLYATTINNLAKTGIKEAPDDLLDATAENALQLARRIISGAKK